MTITITKFESTNQVLFDAIDAMYSLHNCDNDSVDRKTAIDKLRKLADMLESGKDSPDTIALAHDMFIIC